MKKFSLLMLVLVFTAFASHLLAQQNHRPLKSATDSTADRSSPTKKVDFSQVDHSHWNTLLKKYVDEDGMVDYQSWKNTEADKTALKNYLDLLGRSSPQAATPKEARLAFWINAYNALTVHGILEVYPTSSIRNHTAKVLGYNIWHDLPITIDGKDYSLDNIEHKVLRKLGEPRIHFAIVCASIGCPRLLNEAYTANKLEFQLLENSRDFFSRKRNFQADLTKRHVSVSSIIDWFEEDFASTPQKALASLASYLPNDQVKSLVASKKFTVSYLDYDWSLNERRQVVNRQDNDR